MSRLFSLSLALIFIFTSISFASEERLIRWENRLERYEKMKKDMVKKGEPDRGVLRLIDGHIDDSRKFSDILVRAAKGDGSL